MKRSTASETKGEGVVAVEPVANQALNALCDNFGMSRREMERRLVIFAAKAPVELQQIMVGSVPRSMRDAYMKQAVKYLDDAVESPPWK